MKITISRNTFGTLGRLTLGSLCLLLVSACTSFLSNGAQSNPAFYSLDRVRPAEAPSTRRMSKSAPSLLVSTPRAAAGFDSQRMIYLRQAHQLEYFAHSEWVDTPARMLSPLIVAAVSDSGAFRAVLQTPSSASGELRLDSEILLLQQEFLGQPSQVRFVLRASLVDAVSRRIVATRDFEGLAKAPSDDPYGGVLAANQAVQAVLGKLAEFCAEAVLTR